MLRRHYPSRFMYEDSACMMEAIKEGIRIFLIQAIAQSENQYDKETHQARPALVGSNRDRS